MPAPMMMASWSGAAASAASQVTGASVSGVFAHWRRGGVDVKMGAVLVAGGVLGSLLDNGRSSLLGTLIGGGGGALLGREIDRGQVTCR